MDDNQTTEKKPIYKVWWFWVIIAVVFLAMGSLIQGHENESKKTTIETVPTTSTVSKTVTPTPTSTPTPTPTKTKSEISYEVTYSKAKLYKSSIGTVWVQVIYVIENTGVDPLYLSSGAYDLEDADGSLLDTGTLVSVYPQIIKPGEKGYYYEDTTVDNVSVDADVVLQFRPDIAKATVDDIRYKVTDLKIQDTDYFGPEALGRVENTSNEAESIIYISVILFDADDKPIGVLLDLISDELAPGNKIGFEASALTLPDDITAADVDHYEAFAYPYQYQF